MSGIRKVATLEEIIERRQLRRLGNVSRMEDIHLSKKTQIFKIEGKRPVSMHNLKSNL